MADFSPLQKIFATHGTGGERPQVGSRFGLSWPFLIALCVILTGAVAWAFFMGYMVGKGENPGERLGVITGQAEGEKGETPPIFVDAEEKLPLSDNSLENREETNKPLLSVPSSASIPQPVPARPLPKPVAPKASAPQKMPIQQKAGSDTRYDYTFQIAAMRNAAEAENLRKKLLSLKMKATTQKSGKVYLVLVNLRGNHTDVAKFQDRLKKVHTGKPLQVSRKPIETVKANRGR